MCGPRGFRALREAVPRPPLAGRLARVGKHDLSSAVRTVGWDLCEMPAPARPRPSTRTQPLGSQRRGRPEALWPFVNIHLPVTSPMVVPEVCSGSRAVPYLHFSRVPLPVQCQDSCLRERASGRAGPPEGAQAWLALPACWRSPGAGAVLASQAESSGQAGPREGAVCAFAEGLGGAGWPGHRLATHLRGPRLHILRRRGG